jgi:uncharacterized protein (TIRG00374 family)
VPKRNLIVGVVISVVCLILALVGVEWDNAVEALRRADWRYLGPAGAALVGSLLARATRWRVLLGPQVGLLEAFLVTNVGYLVSNVLPLRLGDPARAVAIGLTGKLRFGAALSTVLAERVLDMLTVVLLLSATLPFVAEAGWIRSAGIIGGLAAVTATAFLLTLAWRPAWGGRATDWILGRVPWVDQARWRALSEDLLRGLAALGSFRGATVLMAWSAIVWLLTVGYYLGVLTAFVRPPDVVAASFLTCSTALAVALPSSPGATGVFHSVARYALELPFGVARDTALVVAFASHAFQYVAMCLLGLLGLIQQNLSLAQLRREALAGTIEE